MLNPLKAASRWFAPHHPAAASSHSGVKRLSEMPHGGGSQPIYFLRNLDLRGDAGQYDYRREVGTGTSSSVLMAPIQWVQRSMPEAPLVIERESRGGEWEPMPEHKLARLIDTPNPFYSGLHLWQATVLSFLTDGNGYWVTPLNGMGRPVEIWYAPHWMMEPVASKDGSQFLSHYNYHVNGKRIRLELNEVVHFRHGVDPTNPRRGISPIDSALREIWSDGEAAEFIAALLRNAGVPGLIVSPDGDMVVDPADYDQIKEYVRERTTGARRGEPVVMSGKTKLDRMAWSPKEMDLTPASDRSEERVCALLGIPPAVVGFSAGLETTKVGATMSEMRKLAWWNGIVPLHRNFADEIERALLPAFRDRMKVRARFDTSEVAALQEDRAKLTQRADRMVQGGWITVAAGKRMVGIEPEPGDDVYLRRINTVEVPAAQGQRMLPAPEQRDAEPDGLKQHAMEPPEGTRYTTATDAQTRFIEFQERTADRLAGVMETELVGFFADLGKRAGRAAEPILRAAGKGINGSGAGMKQNPEDTIIGERILEAMNMREITPIFQELHERHYLRVATESTAEAMELIGLATDIPDPVARSIVATGGVRAGLIDLDGQTKRALFQALEEGRALGEGADALVERIQSQIPKGPWSTPEIRARVIARTETKHAQRMSVLHMSREEDVQEFLVFDARLGDTDAECMSWDGAIVSSQQADALAADEHPNGTRDFVPYFD